MKIYHNPRCKNSRAGLEYLKNKTSDFEIKKYLSDGITKEELDSLLQKMDKNPEEMIRTQEDYYKKNLKGKKLSRNEWIEEMVKNPKLIKRPVIEKGDKAVLAQPPEEIDKLL